MVNAATPGAVAKCVFPAGFNNGLVSAYEEHETSGAVLLRKDYTWTQDAGGKPYLGTVLSTLNSTAQTKTVQTLDANGNIQTSNIYDYGNLSTAARTYTYTYLTDSNYTSRYIRNRLLTATVTSSAGAITLVNNCYDNTLSCSSRIGGLINNFRLGLPLHDDTNYGVGFTYRGNATDTSTLSATTHIAYDILGVAYQTQNGAGQAVNVTPDPTYSLPGILIPGGNSNLETSISYAASWAVTSVTGPNGATATTSYDGSGRPLVSTIPDGARTDYQYTYNPNTQGHRHIEESRRVWEHSGFLWAQQDTTPPVSVTVESNPIPVRCFPRVD